MKKFYLLVFIQLLFQTLTNQQIKQNPILLGNTLNPCVLSTTDDYFYVITKGTSFKINKESGNLEKKNNSFTNYLCAFDNSNNNYLCLISERKYYSIKYNPFISYEEIIDNNSKQKSYSSRMKIFGSVAKDNEFIIYGLNLLYLIFLSIPQYDEAKYLFGTTMDYLSCKFITDDIFVCAMISSSKLRVNCFEYFCIFDK